MKNFNKLFAAPLSFSLNDNKILLFDLILLNKASKSFVLDMVEESIL